MGYCFALIVVVHVEALVVARARLTRLRGLLGKLIHQLLLLLHIGPVGLGADGINVPSFTREEAFGVAGIAITILLEWVEIVGASLFGRIPLTVNQVNYKGGGEDKGRCPIIRQHVYSLALYIYVNVQDITTIVIITLIMSRLQN